MRPAPFLSRPVSSPAHDVGRVRASHYRAPAMRVRPTLTLALAILVASGCSEPPPPAWQPTPIFHDFGMIPHGKIAAVRLGIDFPTDRGPMLPLAFQGNCSCASWAFVAVDPKGNERVTHGRAAIEHCVVPGEKLFLELRLDTNRKEALEQKPVTNHGEVFLVDLHEKVGRVAIPVTFTFGIDAPVTLKPFATVDFGPLPLSRVFTVAIELHARGTTPVHFGPVRAGDPRVTARLIEQDGLTLLDIRVQPDAGRGLGALNTVIRVGTDLPDGYEIPIPVTGSIVDDVEVKPMERVSFGRFDFTAPQEGFVILQDFDDRRDPAFEVRGVRSIVGKDLAQHIETDLQPIDGNPRAARLFIRYRGTLAGVRSFRGFVDVGKHGAEGSVASVEFVGFSDG